MLIPACSRTVLADTGAEAARHAMMRLWLEDCSAGTRSRTSSRRLNVRADSLPRIVIQGPSGSSSARCAGIWALTL